MRQKWVYGGIFGERKDDQFKWISAFANAQPLETLWLGIHGAVDMRSG